MKPTFIERGRCHPSGSGRRGIMPGTVRDPPGAAADVHPARPRSSPAIRPPAGGRRLVALRRTPPPLRQSWDVPLCFTATLIDPAGLRDSPVASTALLPDPLPSAFGDGSADGPALRLFAGRADPVDESHFT